MSTSRPAPLVIGVPEAAFGLEDLAVLREVRPAGMILFRRNGVDRDPLRRLIDSFRRAVDLEEAVVMVDQEGGRVQQLRGPGWPDFPSARRLGRLAATDPEAAVSAAHALGRAIGVGLAETGVDTVCAPVLDLDLPEGDAVIGDRAFAGDPALVARLGRATAQGFLSAGITPIVKHIPGHGRAPVDSHKATPRVTADLTTLAASDFAPFRDLRDLPWAMVAHVVYNAVDGRRPASVSPTVVHQVVRDRIGFAGPLVSDCVYMDALTGSIAERCRAVVDAGVDLALACHGTRQDWPGWAEAVGPMPEASWARLRADHARRQAVSIDAAGLRPDAVAADLNERLPEDRNP